MKTLKINLVAVFAVLLSLVAMSFQMSNGGSTSGPGWYRVGAPVSGNLPIGTKYDGLPDGGCSTFIDVNICGVEWTEAGSPPQFVHQIEGDPNLAGRDD